jgi:hypothetical protein
LLPLILYLPTGSYLLEADKKLTNQVCTWFASKGYVVAALHTRKGMSVTNGELTKRAMFREWQDLRVAYQYWKLKTPTSSKWKINPNKIYALGHGSGGITVLNNAMLDLHEYNAEKADFLEPTTGNYNFPTLAEDIALNALTGELAAKLKDAKKEVEVACRDADLVGKVGKIFDIMYPENAPHDPVNCAAWINKAEEEIYKHLDFKTYDLNDSKHASYPCLGVGQDPCNITEIAINAFATQEAQANKVVSLSGALPKLEWLENLEKNNIPVRAVHHEKDGVIAFNEQSEPFGEFLYLLEETDWFINGTNEYPRYYGSKMIEDSNNASEYFKLLSLQGEWTAGGEPYNHHPQSKFGLQYDRNEGVEPILEPKVMFYVDAFFSKDHDTGSHARSQDDLNPTNTLATDSNLKTEVNNNVLLIPNPTSDFTNIAFEAKEPGTLTIEVVGLGGRIFSSTKMKIQQGKQQVKLVTNKLKNGIYILRGTGTGIKFVKKLIIMRN